METDVIFYLREFAPHKLNHISYIEWAINQIEKGNNCEILYELAGLYKNAEYSELEIEKYFLSCIKELCIKQPITEEKNLINYCCFMCNAIIIASSIESVEHLVGELTCNIEDFNISALEPLLNLSEDLSIVKYNGIPKHYTNMKKENAFSLAKEISVEFIKVNA